jgi:hypothetical protein
MKRLILLALFLASTFSAAQLATVHTESATIENLPSYLWAWPTSAGNQLRICVQGPVIGSAGIWVFVDPVNGVRQRVLPQAPWGIGDNGRLNLCYMVWAKLGSNVTTTTMQFLVYGPGIEYDVRLDEFGTPLTLQGSKP